MIKLLKVEQKISTGHSVAKVTINGVTTTVVGSGSGSIKVDGGEDEPFDNLASKSSSELFKLALKSSDWIVADDALEILVERNELYILLKLAYGSGARSIREDAADALIDADAVEYLKVLLNKCIDKDICEDVKDALGIEDED